MSKLIYAEPDDEITTLVDRLRSEKSEKELVFVLPGASRVMQSNLNARLLRQYSNTLGKTTSVISPDPRTQTVAIETGFAVFPTLAAFESGSSIDRALDPGPAVPATAPEMTAAAPLAEEPAPVPPARRRSSPPPPVMAPPATAATTRKPIIAGAGRPGYIPYVLGGVGVVLILLILFFFVLPSATVQVVIPARAISAAPTITGSTTPPGPSDVSSVQTVVQQAQEQQAQQVNSTGVKQIPSVASTGSVVFTYDGSFPGVNQVDFPVGTEVSTDDGKRYVTTADSGPVDHGGGHSGSVPIQARGGGKAGDVAAGTIKNITNNVAPSNLTVTNPAATGGGADASQKTVVSQADQDAVKKSLGDQLTQKVKADLQKSAGTQKLLDETLMVAVDASFDKKPGDEAPNFNANVTVKASQTSLDDAKVKEVIKNALHRTIPRGYDFTDNPLKLDYKLAQKDDKGGVVLDAKASGFMQTAINKDVIRSHISGQSIAKARAYIQGNIDSSSVVIRESPSMIPWLPFISSRIDVSTTVQNPVPG